MRTMATAGGHVDLSAVVGQHPGDRDIPVAARVHRLDPVATREPVLHVDPGPGSSYFAMKKPQKLVSNFWGSVHMGWRLFARTFNSGVRNLRFHAALSC